MDKFFHPTLYNGCIYLSMLRLTHWGRVTHICVGNLTIIGPDNGLSPGRRQAITWTNAGKLLNGPLGTNFSEILIEIPTFSSKKMRLKVSSAIWRPSCLGLYVLKFIQVTNRGPRPMGIASQRTTNTTLRSFSFVNINIQLYTTISNKIIWMQMLSYP